MKRAIIQHGSWVGAVLLLLITPHLLPAQGSDYVTEEEADLIRDAQGLKLRVPAFLQFADNRIVALGLRELTAKERDKARKDLEAYEREVREAAKVPEAEIRAKPVNPAVYLRNYSKLELLRGYMQVLDEAMHNIDDAYERNLEVREAVEQLEEFISSRLPLLKKFQPQTDRESTAIRDAIEHSEEALDEARAALEVVPKTQRKSPRP